jgi:hypothetical protein
MTKIIKADEVAGRRGSVYPGALAEPLQKANGAWTFTNKKDEPRP